MSTYKKLVELEESHNSAMLKIREYLHTPSSMQPLVEWILSSDMSVYDYMPRDWAHTMYQAGGVADVLGMIHHALYDDGEIEFVKVNGKPFMVFYGKWEPGFESHVIEQVLYSEDPEDHCNVEVLPRHPEQFVELLKQQWLRLLKGYILWDAGQFGKTSKEEGWDFAVSVYSGKHMFDQIDLEELKGIYDSGNKREWLKYIV